MLKKNEGNSYRVLRRTENIGWSGNTRSNGCCFGTCCTVLLEDIYLKVQVQVTVDDRSCSTVPRYGGEYGGTATIEGEQGGREMMRPANR
jgi:hypothetical protein